MREDKKDDVKEVDGWKEQIKMMLYYLVRLPWMLWDRRK
jgi:hypothetical protein